MNDANEKENRARTVWLIRHAKAAEPEQGQKDFERPLTRRGERQCAAMRDWLRKRLEGTETNALFSPARRARRTAELVLDDWFEGARLEEARIWNATAQALAALLEEHEGSNLLLVGHNPGLEQLQAALSGQLMPMPTGGVFELEFGAQGRVRLAHRFQPEIDSR